MGKNMNRVSLQIFSFFDREDRARSAEANQRKEVPAGAPCSYKLLTVLHVYMIGNGVI